MEAAPPPYSYNPSTRRDLLNSSTAQPVPANAPRSVKDEANETSKYLIPKWGIHARHPHRLEVATIILTIITVIIIFIDGGVVHSECIDGYYNCINVSWYENGGLWFAAHLVLPIVTLAHSFFIKHLMVISPPKIAAHPRLFYRPAPIYSLLASFVLLCAWAGQLTGWLIVGYVGEYYGSAGTMSTKVALAALIAFVQVLYVGFASDAICGRDAIKRRRARKEGARVDGLSAEERPSEDVELGRVDVRDAGK